MPKLTIDDQEIEVEAGTSILQAAEALGVEIPRFCYHDKLSVPANCRMCLVELEGAPKPVASCAMAAGDGMVIKTKSETTKKARRGVMEMLLINHPLDCPICDQGGECDLQDQAVGYGFDRSRYHENKRAVKDKELGPLIKTIMTRCINCTRCVRFAEEIAGVPDLGQLHRGEDAEIDTFVEKAVESELSGNLIDICPVGALTSKPYAFTARPWELRKTETIDVHDALGCNIRVDVRGREVMRILPRLHEDINEEWIDDRSRFSYDGLKENRLDRPWIRDLESRKMRPCSWEEALDAAAGKISATPAEKIAAFAGDLCDSESVLALKDFMRGRGAENLECRVDGARFDVSDMSGYLFNTSLAGLEHADAILLAGVNPRHEAALLNARIRRLWLDRGIPVGLIGPAAELTYPYAHLGIGPQDLEKLLQAGNGTRAGNGNGNGNDKERGKGFADILRQAQRPAIIVGAGAFCREDGPAVQALAREVAEHFGMITQEWNGFNVLHRAAGRVGALELGFTPPQPFDIGGMGLVYLLNTDQPQIISRIDEHAFVIYQGHHGDAGAMRADLILPGAAYTEKDGLYMNTEGRAQMARKAGDPPGEAKEDWKIIRALSERAGQSLRYDNLFQLRERLFHEFPQFGLIDEIPIASWGAFGQPGPVSGEPFHAPAEDFYQTNVICRASPTMRECSRAFAAPCKEYEEAAE